MRRPKDTEAARIKATVDSESRPYTDPKAQYPAAVNHRRTRGGK